MSGFTNHTCPTRSRAYTRSFAPPIQAFGGGREHLADTVRCELHEGSVGQLGHPTAAPACEVGNQNVGVEVNLRLVEDDPSARAAAPSVERPHERGAQVGRGARMPKPRSGVRVKLASDDLPHYIGGQRTEVGVGGEPGCGRGHPFSVGHWARTTKCSRAPGMRAIFGKRHGLRRARTAPGPRDCRRGPGIRRRCRRARSWAGARR